jgi:hypothetical protein
MRPPAAEVYDPDVRLPRSGRFLGLPYDWRRPTKERVRQEVWNTDERRLLTPKAFGWGYGLNLAEVARRLGLRREDQRDD